MPPVGFEPTISAGERLQTYAFERTATGTGRYRNYKHQIILKVTHKDLMGMVKSKFDYGLFNGTAWGE
jgi:hypothetical protein